MRDGEACRFNCPAVDLWVLQPARLGIDQSFHTITAHMEEENRPHVSSLSVMPILNSMRGILQLDRWENVRLKLNLTCNSEGRVSSALTAFFFCFSLHFWSLL